MLSLPPPRQRPARMHVLISPSLTRMQASVEDADLSVAPYTVGVRGKPSKRSGIRRRPIEPARLPTSEKFIDFYNPLFHSQLTSKFRAFHNVKSPPKGIYLQKPAIHVVTLHRKNH